MQKILSIIACVLRANGNLIRNLRLFHKHLMQIDSNTNVLTKMRRMAQNKCAPSNAQTSSANNTTPQRAHHAFPVLGDMPIKKNACLYCKKTFTTDYELGRHSRSHTGRGHTNHSEYGVQGSVRTSVMCA